MSDVPKRGRGRQSKEAGAPSSSGHSNQFDLSARKHEEFAVIAAKRQEVDMEDSAPHYSRPRRMLNEKQVLDIVPLSRTSIYRLEKAGKFPRSTYISANRRIWYEDEIVDWQRAVDEFNPNRGRGKGRRRRV
jgi:predicted DNA-binding transcriptional regulator AlpA